MQRLDRHAEELELHSEGSWGLGMVFVGRGRPLGILRRSQRKGLRSWDLNTYHTVEEVRPRDDCSQPPSAAAQS